MVLNRYYLFAEVVEKLFSEYTERGFERTGDNFQTFSGHRGVMFLEISTGVFVQGDLTIYDASCTSGKFSKQRGREKIKVNLRHVDLEYDNLKYYLAYVNATNLNDEKMLVLKTSAGDEDAFASLYNYYYSSVKQFVLKFVKSTELAEDISQEVFLRIWEGKRKLAEVNSFRAYLFIAARNHTINTLQSASRKAAAMGEIVKHYQAQRNNTEENLLHHEYMAFLKKVIETLPPRSREVFRLCREQNKKYEEVAAMLGISRNSVKNHMVLSMKILKNAVERDLDIPLPIFLIVILWR